MSISTVCELHNGKIDNSEALQSHLKEKYHSAYHFLVPVLCITPTIMGFGSLTYQAGALYKPKLFRYSNISIGVGTALLVAATSFRLFSKNRKDDASGKSCEICTFINPMIKEQYKGTNSFCTKVLFLDFFVLLGAACFQYSNKIDLKTLNVNVFKSLGAAALIYAAYQAFCATETGYSLDQKLNANKLLLKQFSIRFIIQQNIA